MNRLSTLAVSAVLAMGMSGAAIAQTVKSAEQEPQIITGTDNRVTAGTVAVGVVILLLTIAAASSGD